MLILAGGDMHHPFQDEAVEKDFIHAAKHQKPDHIVLLGDVVDFYNTSRYIKKGKAFNVQDEIDIAKEFLQRLRAAAPSSTQIWWTQGNHDERPEKYMARQCPELQYLRNMELPILMDLGKLNIHWYTANKELRLDKVLYLHGTRVRKHPGDSVQAHILEDYHCSVVMGHCHRSADISIRHNTEWFTGVETGCMCTDEAGTDYVKKPYWTRGFCFMSNGIPSLIRYNH